MKFDEQAIDYWRCYWNTRYAKAPCDDEGLLCQVARTVNGKPIPLETIRQSANKIAAILDLSPNDDLVDFCCGNGLIDFELAPHVKSIVAIDFAENMIHAAQRLKQRPNIRYRIGNITDRLSALIGRDQVPNKFLMAGSLGYLQPRELSAILGNIGRHLDERAFEFLIEEIPNAELKANFYNTPERVARHLENERTHPDTNDGVGRWWRAEEIETLCAGHGLSVQIMNPPASLWNYRMDALIRGGQSGSTAN